MNAENKNNSINFSQISANIIKQNIKFLNENKNKIYFEFDQKGKIHKMSLWHRIFYSSKKFNEIKNHLNEFTKSIKITESTSDEDKIEIKKLFFEIFPKISKSRKFYERDIDETVLNYLADQLRCLPQTNLSTSQVDESIQKETSNNLDNKSFKATRSVVTTAQVWAKMGNSVKSNAGCSISYRIVEGGANGKILGIFKASSEEPFGKKNTKLVQRIKRLALKLLPSSIVGSLNETETGQGFVSEVVQKKVADRVLNIVQDYEHKLEKEGKITDEMRVIFSQIKSGIVPNTEIVNFELGKREKEIGSFQEWIQEEHQDAYKFFGLKNKKYEGTPNQNSISDELFDLLVIIDYTIGNSDRHGENWFIITTKDGQQQNRVSGIRLIDGGWSMAPKHPISEKAIELKSQYKWRHFALADQGFLIRKT